MNAITFIATAGEDIDDGQAVVCRRNERGDIIAWRAAPNDVPAFASQNRITRGTQITMGMGAATSDSPPPPPSRSFQVNVRAYFVHTATIEVEAEDGHAALTKAETQAKADTFEWGAGDLQEVVVEGFDT